MGTEPWEETWFVEEDYDVCKKEGDMHLHIGGDLGFTTRAQAALVAAAPELYRALRGMLDNCTCHTPECRAARFVAIRAENKARGFENG